MQTKSKHTQLLAAALTIALLLAGILTLLHGIPLFRADAAEAQSEEANVYADWKFSEENSSGSLEDNTLVIEDASGNGNDLEIVTSENGAKASDFLAFEDISMTGDAQSMKFNGFKEEDQEQLDTLSGDAREQYILNDLEYAYLRTADEGTERPDMEKEFQRTSPWPKRSEKSPTTADSRHHRPSPDSGTSSALR